MAPSLPYRAISLCTPETLVTGVGRAVGSAISRCDQEGRRMGAIDPQLSKVRLHAYIFLRIEIASRSV